MADGWGGGLCPRSGPGRALCQGPAGGPGPPGFLRAAVAGTLRFGGAASKALTSKKTGNWCCLLRNTEGLSHHRAPWIPALMQDSTPSLCLPEPKKLLPPARCLPAGRPAPASQPPPPGPSLPATAARPQPPSHRRPAPASQPPPPGHRLPTPAGPPSPGTRPALARSADWEFWT